MNSLGLKSFTDLNVGILRGNGSGQRSYDGILSYIPTGSRRSCVHLGGGGVRTPRIFSCSSQKDGGSVGGGESPGPSPIAKPDAGRSSFLSGSQTYALLKQQMEVAAKSEDYKEAARIRDSLRLFEEDEPVLRLRRLLKEAIAEERFQDAAQYRDELKAISPHSLLKCSSDITTVGIRVQVRSVYIEGRSQPSKGQYFFAYRIRITNNSDRPIQLLRRHWIITDANGKSENFWGIGVIGEQPVLLPKTGFEYSSACPLGTSSGGMEGEYEMKYIDKAGSDTFNVEIAPFALSTLDDTDTI
ncbi:hypothetical protein V2J09_006819 [Rumex salicifolius]